MEMEWSAKWDCGNFVAFGSKSIESSKKLQLADWMIVDDVEIHGGSFNLPAAAAAGGGGGGNSSASGSDGGRGSSTKNSISASTDSSTRDGMQTPNFGLSTIEGSPGNFSNSQETKGAEASGGSAGALLGLKLGKRTYFENAGGGCGSIKSTSFSVVPAPSTTTSSSKKTKSSGQNVRICCQVEGCNIDLSTAKEYHRKHRVCDNHSKCPKVIVAGRERRFCQQCSRFHGLSEFDEKKRSCRRRLYDHNARRRKSQQESIQFDPTRLSTAIYGGNQQMSILLNNSQLAHSRAPGNYSWDGACHSKFTLTKGYSSKSNGDGVTNEQLQMPRIKMPQAVINVQSAANGLLASKNSTPAVLNPGSKGSLISSQDAAPEFRRALSLLSTNSWDSCKPAPIPLQYQVHENYSRSLQSTIDAVPEGVPLSSSDFWPSGQQSTHPPVPSLAVDSNFQEMQLFKTPYDADFYSNILN